MNKIQFKIRYWLFFLILLFCGPVFGQTDTLSFLHITDLHVIFNQSIYPADFINYRKLRQYDQGENRLRQFFDTIPEKTNSHMVIATGDLIDFFEVNTTDGQMLDIQSRQFSRLLNDYHVPVYLTLGNHDLFSFNWENGLLQHDQNSSGRARTAWIRNIPCFHNGTYYSEIYRVGQTTYHLIFLDNAFYQFLPTDSTSVPYIDKSQLYWLNTRLKDTGSDIVIIFMHIPFDLNDTRPESLNELYSLLTGNPSVKLIFSGHYHKNVIEHLYALGREIVQVQTGSLVQGTGNWRLVRLTEKNILVSIPGKTESELKIPVK